MSNEIAIESEFHGAEELEELLVQELPREVTLESRAPTVRLRGMDAAVLVALATGSSHILIALVTGLLNVLQKKVGEPGTIVVRWSDGSSLEFPSTMNKDQIEELVRLRARLSPTRIEVVRN